MQSPELATRQDSAVTGNKEVSSNLNLANLTNSEYLAKQEPTSLVGKELAVLGGGLVDGLQRMGATTAGDLSKAWEDFKSNPLSATGNYLANHWQDAAVGATLTFLNPKKWVNYALLGYSMRGVGYAGWDAATGAASGTDLTQVKERFADAISHEGTAFLSSLPLAMAGGSVGRAGANAVFGKGMGALDMIGGKVTMQEVKANLWNLHDRINPPPIKLVITDMDNTLAPFSKYFAEGLKKSMPEMSKNTGIPEAELYRDIGQHMEKMRSHDYPWSLELALAERLKVGKEGGMSVADFEAKVADPFWRGMGESMKEHHVPFPGVVDTLQKLKDKNIPVVVLSDAPAFIGLKRLHNLGLDKGLVERMFALRNWHEPEGLPAAMKEGGQARLDKMLSIKHGLTEFLAIPAEFEKPNPSGFNMILDRYNVRPREVLMIGDSRVKDVGVAHQAGSYGIWARYGQPDLVDEAVLTRLRPLPEGGSPAAKKVYPPMLAQVDNYASLLEYLQPRTDYSSLLSSTGKSLLVMPEIRTGIVASGTTKKRPL